MGRLLQAELGMIAGGDGGEDVCVVSQLELDMVIAEISENKNRVSISYDRNLLDTT